MTLPREKYRDQKIAALEKQVAAIYRVTQKNVERSLESFAKKHKAQDERNRKAVADGKMTLKEYRKWLQSEVYAGEAWKKKKNDVANLLYQANYNASQMTNDVAVDVFASSANRTAYRAEHDFGKVLGFTLMTIPMARKLFKSNLQTVSKTRDTAWNRHNIDGLVARLTVTGMRVPEISKSIAVQVLNRNRQETNRRIEEFIGGADGAGTMETLHKAEELGITVKKKWLATLDNKTRDTHAELDGQVVGVDEPFKVWDYKIMYPRDPSAEPEMRCNCRCTMEEVFEKYPIEAERRENIRNFDNVKPIVPSMTYREWEAMHGNF